MTLTNNNMSEFKINSKITYWTYRIDDLFWTQLEKNFTKKHFFVSSVKQHAIKKNDIVLIFKNHKTPSKSGFVAMCKVETNMIHNNTNIKIFADKNMNIFCCELESVFMFDKIIALSNMKSIIENFNPTLFRKSYIGENTIFVKLNNSVAQQIIPVMTECVPQTDNSSNYEITEEDIDNISDFENDEIESEHIESSNDDNDDIEVKLGNFPILFDPIECKKFKCSSDPETMINNIKHHFQYCNSCNKCDNNPISVISKFKNGIFHFDEINNEKEVDNIVDHYISLKYWRIELSGSTKKQDHIFIRRVYVPSGHLYNDSYFILW